MSFRGGSAKAGDRFFDTSVARPPVFLCRNPGAIRSPDSGDGVHLMCLVSVCFIKGGRNLGLVSCPESGLQNAPGSRHRKIKKQCRVCDHFGTLVPPVSSGPCPSTAQTSVCQCYGGCNVQPVPQTAGAAGLLEISGLGCAKHSSVRETMFATVPALHLC